MIQKFLDIIEGNTYIFFNWELLHATLNSHYEEWSYKKKKCKYIKEYREAV